MENIGEGIRLWAIKNNIKWPQARGGPRQGTFP